MRLATFRSGEAAHVGVRRGEDLVDLAIAAPELPASLIGILGLADGVERARAAAAHAGSEARRPMASVSLLPPIPEPGKIICLGLNYPDHAAESALEKPAAPNIFLRTAQSLVAHGAPIVRPAVSSALDFEGELAVVIGRNCRNTPREQALAAVAGYSVFNDGSVRDFQMRASQWTLGKNFDATGGFGPELVTADELPEGAAGLKLQTRLNGEAMQVADTAEMIFGVAETIAYVSQAMTLVPGDVLVMGTPAGVGFARRPPVWMKPGDVCEVEIERIGVLRNPIAAG
ncbi:MAG TPA: fumarylacetoacetate hydrolase family protein [Phenylobacterium sp.]|uniref:fumarylacetoacetate hydrolase family protein n=1 Tax=Phenylobacterium sp. TaxID=1871053 RepID=UPI002BE38AF3|nr:fumarylacetoacetate hydrolase family protein [Phenylobacterium sp.]HSV03298.1 fumarylacetoacetate hydrolase family protein [Phenylobacterium sp.]